MPNNQIVTLPLFVLVATPFGGVTSSTSGQAMLSMKLYGSKLLVKSPIWSGKRGTANSYIIKIPTKTGRRYTPFSDTTHTSKIYGVRWEWEWGRKWGMNGNGDTPAY